MSNQKFVTVNVTMICEKSIEVQVLVPIESLEKDKEGIYSFDAIQEIAQGLAESEIIRSQDFDSIILDSAEVIDCPEDFEYWC
jgi:hypothetical protein